MIMHIDDLETSTWDTLSAASRFREDPEINPLYEGAHTTGVHAYVIEDSPNISALRALLVVKTEHVRFDGRDSKQRTVGAIIVTWQRGDRFYARPQATRDGREYGASSGDREFASAAERDAWRAKYLATAAKRAASKA